MSRFLLVLTLLWVLASALVACQHVNRDWRSASRASVGLAPDPQQVHEAVVQVYGARAVGAKGVFGVHTWVAAKPTDATHWTVYEVIGWRQAYGADIVAIHERDPDGRWFGAEPQLYAERRGAGVDALIARIDAAARSYPYARTYRAWPGPNSNTFTAWITRSVPELAVDLPATAIGKDWLGSAVIGTPPGGRGAQVSLAGVLGISIGPVDGLEFNLLGLNFGVSGSGIKLPILGRIGSELPVHAGGGTPESPSR